MSDDTLCLFSQQHDDTNYDWAHRDDGKPVCLTMTLYLMKSHKIFCLQREKGTH